MWQTTRAEFAQPYWLALQSEVYRKLQMPENRLNAVREAVDLGYKTGERTYEAELYRLKGELLLTPKEKNPQGTKIKNKSIQEAEQCFHQAIEIACHQSAKSLELRGRDGGRCPPYETGQCDGVRQNKTFERLRHVGYYG